MLYDLTRKIDIQFRPIEMTGRRLFNIEDLANRDILEPREVLVGQEQFPLTGQKPYSMTGDVCDLNG